MKSFNFGYKAGYYLGVVLIYTLYLVGIVAFVIDVYHLSLPILPLTYLFVLGVWRKLMQIHVGLNFTGTLNEKIAAMNHLIEQEKKFNYYRSNKFGGPN